MNKVVLSGFIAADVELKTTQQGTPVCTFDLGVRRPKTKEKVTDFIRIVCWESTAEFVSRYFRKGSGIEVSGCLTVRKWKDKDDKTRYATEVRAEEVDFGKSSKSDREQDGGLVPSTTPDPEFYDVGNDEDLPF